MSDIEKAIERLKIDKVLIQRHYISPTNDEEFDVAISALEKQIPKKPIETYELGYICPSCKGGMIYSPNITDNKHDDCNYCNECGQKLDWSEVQE